MYHFLWWYVGCFFGRINREPVRLAISVVCFVCFIMTVEMTERT